MKIQVTFDVDPEAGKPFVPSLYFRRNDDDSAEVGLLNRAGRDYAWAAMPKDQFLQVAKTLYPEEFKNA